ncbi:MAG: hypothetical protein J7513_05580 [Solirubrobacteraceae bacterium]|nr:hypothetical protein [Solirubrobacteraceae bacterium]
MMESADPARHAARDALVSAAAAQRSLVDRPVDPAGADLAYAAGMGVTLAATVALGAMNHHGRRAQVAAAALFLAALAVFWIAGQRFRRANGFWVDGHGPGRAGRVAGVLTFVATLWSIGAGLAGGYERWELAAAAVVLGTATAYGLARLWIRMVDRELRAGAGRLDA